MSISRRQVVSAGALGVVLVGLPVLLGGCGGSTDDKAKMDPAQEKMLADQKRATEEFYASKKKKK